MLKDVGMIVRSNASHSLPHWRSLVPIAWSIIRDMLWYIDINCHWACQNCLCFFTFNVAVHGLNCAKSRKTSGICSNTGDEGNILICSNTGDNKIDVGRGYASYYCCMPSSPVLLHILLSFPVLLHIALVSLLYGTAISTSFNILMKMFLLSCFIGFFFV